MYKEMDEPATNTEFSGQKKKPPTPILFMIGDGTENKEVTFEVYFSINK